MNEVPFVVASLVGAVGPLAILFLWNVACAPYRIERDGRIAATARLEELQNLSTQRTPRRLSAEKQGLFASALRNAGARPQRLNVIHFGTEEPADFAADLGDAIKMTGIECTVHDGGYYTKDPKDRGLKLLRDPKNEQVCALAGALAGALEELGFPCEIRDVDGEGTIFFYVARPSEAN